MSYGVLFTEGFRRDVADHVDYLREQFVSDDIIERWYDRLFILVEDLGTLPKRCAVDERLTESLGREIRKLVYARYVITYHVDDARHRVHILAMVHGARRK